MDKNYDYKNKNLTMTITQDWIPEETKQTIDSYAKSLPNNKFVSLKTMNSNINNKFKLNLTNKHIPILESGRNTIKISKNISRHPKYESINNLPEYPSDKTIPSDENETFIKSSYQNTDRNIYKKSFSNRSTFYNTNLNNNDTSFYEKKMQNQYNKNEKIIMKKANTHKPLKIVDYKASSKNPTRLMLLNQFETCDSSDCTYTKTQNDLSFNKFRNFNRNIVGSNNSKFNIQTSQTSQTRHNQTQTTKASSFINTQFENFNQPFNNDIPLLKQNVKETIDTNFKIVNSLSDRKTQEIIENWAKVQIKNRKKFKNISLLNKYILGMSKVTNAPPLKVSAHRMELTQQFLFEREKKQKEKSLKEMHEYETKFGKKIYLDDIFESKENSYLDPYISDEEVKNFPKITSEYLKKEKDKISEKAKRYVEVIENFNQTNYEAFQHNEFINHKNLRKIVRFRQILKNKDDPYDDQLGLNKIENFQKITRKENEDTTRALVKLGPPSFLKTKFKMNTIKKYINLSGGQFVF